MALGNDKRGHYRHPSSGSGPRPLHLTSKFAESSSLYSYEIVELRETAYRDRDSRAIRWIQRLRAISRVLALLLSLTTVIPLVIVIVKYFQTRNNLYQINGKQESAWPEHTVPTYTYAYFGVSSLSLLLNAFNLLAFICLAQRRNRKETDGMVSTSIFMILHLAIWAASVAIYRYGKQKVDGEWRDLWGYTCSSTAAGLQPFVGDIDFHEYCIIQDISYYSGIAQVGVSELFTVIFVLAIMRMRWQD